MNVLLVSAEAAPFAKVGGLADVVGSLPKALRQLDVDARVIMPLYGTIDRSHHQINPLFWFRLRRSTGTTDVHIHTVTYDGVPFYFIQGWPFFGDETSVYGKWDWDLPRFIFFCQAVLAALVELRDRDGWYPDVLHVNDWHTALIPYLVTANRSDSTWSNVKTVLSIHNLAYQGEYAGGWLWELGIPGRHHPDLVALGLTDNLLAMGIAYADKLSTVSPRYAIEIGYPYMGYGLDKLITRRANDLVGILNGIDVEAFNPETDPALVSNYNAQNFVEQRPPNKRQVQLDSGLDVAADMPIIGMVTRLVAQKGLDLALPALRRLLVDTRVQFVILGAGDDDISAQVWRLGQDFHWRARTFLHYNALLAQRIYAGCDIFLMPSRYEPCGMGQMIAMRYGALPLVRETGGLADTVQNYDGRQARRGTGFVFNWEEPEAVLGTIRWALDTYYNRPQAWQRMQKRAMKTDFSWRKSAQQYLDLYNTLIGRSTEGVTTL